MIVESLTHKNILPIEVWHSYSIFMVMSRTHSVKYFLKTICVPVLTKVGNELKRVKTS